MTETVGDARLRLFEIQVVNSSDTAVFNLALVLRSKNKNARSYELPVKVDGGHWSGQQGYWTLSEWRVLPPGTSTVKLLLDMNEVNPPIPSIINIGIGFRDRNGRKWTRRLDGALTKGWKVSSQKGQK